jgi:hypothetical protein
VNWSDERYVRVYTRDTVDWQALGWEGQALFVLLLRKVDRAGIFEMGRHGARGVAAMLAMPPDVVERALPVLLEDGCVERRGTTLVVRNFIEAQEASMSPGHRQKESREKRRDMLRAGFDPDMRETVIYFIQSEHGGPIKIGRADDLAKRLVNLQTSRPDKLVVLATAPGTVQQERDLHARFAAAREKGEWFSPVPDLVQLVARVVSDGASAFGVTDRDVSPRTVPAVPCLAVPKEELSSGKPDTRPASESDDDASDDDPPALPFAAPAVAKPSPTEDAITAVLTDWQARSGMAKAAIVGPKARKRRTRIRQRLAEGYTPDELRQVVSGMLRDGFLMGTDPKSKPGGYRDVATVFRDSEQCDRLIGLAEDGTIAAPSRPADSGGRILRIDPPKPVNPRTPETDEAVRRMMAEFRAASVEASNG